MSADGPIIWMAGTNWDAVAGTDKRLVQELAATRPVMWVDPPVPVRVPRRGSLRSRLEQLDDSLLRLRVMAPPGVTRPLIRRITALWQHGAIRSAVTRAGWEPAAVVSAMPLARFPRGVGGAKILYVTDDWLEGSRLMGISRSAVRSVLASNLAQADGVAAVSVELLGRLAGLNPAGVPGLAAPAGQPARAVIPNGCPEPAGSMPPVPREPAACLVGTLNERLDLDVLEAVQASGVKLVVIGPRSDRSPSFGLRLDALLKAENVRWMGQLAAEELPGQLSTFGAGITPYTDSPFNRASFPLKTLEYLAAGLAVVSTDMPSARWLNTNLISVQTAPQEFALAVKAALAQRNDGDGELLRKEFASGHTWAARALEFQALLDGAANPGAHAALQVPAAPGTEAVR